MNKLKFYNILFVADEKSRLSIENLRIKLTGSKLVDLQPPHVTLKRKFRLKPGFSENDLIEALRNFNIEKTVFICEKIEIFGSAIVAMGNNQMISEKHKELLAILKNYVETINPEWEGNNFNAHMTIVRDPEKKLSLTLGDLGERNIVLDKIGLVEMDPSNDKTFSRKIYSKEAN